MTIQSSRFTIWFAWILAGWATLVWLPRLAGTEPNSPPVDRPKAVVLDVHDASDLAPNNAAELQTTAPESRLLGPLERDPESEQKSDPPTLRVPDIVVPFPKEPVPVNAPVADATTPRTPDVAVPPPNTTTKALKLPLPPTPEANVAATPQVVPNVKYWIVSTRCCQQSAHRCGSACRFVCHAVTHDCQMIPVCLPTMLTSLMPGAPTCIQVHGSFTRWQDVRTDSECTYQWLRSPCPQAPLNFIYFTWPSEGVFTLVPNNPFSSPVVQWDMAILGRRAEYNGFYLADLIGCLPGNASVCLLGHSLGTRAIASSLQLLAGGTIQGHRRWNPADCGCRIRVVMAAAAIDHDWFNPGQRFSCALNRAECVLNLQNEYDLALATYPLRRPFSSRALGRAGFTNKDHRKLGTHSGQVADLDVSELVGHGHTWPRFVQRPEIAAAIAPSVFFETITLSAADSNEAVPTTLSKTGRVAQ